MKNSKYISKNIIESITRRVILEELKAYYGTMLEAEEEKPEETSANSINIENINDVVDDIASSVKDMLDDKNISEKTIKSSIFKVLTNVRSLSKSNKISKKDLQEVISNIAKNLNSKKYLETIDAKKIASDIVGVSDTPSTSDDAVDDNQPDQPDTDADADSDTDATPDTKDDKKEKGGSVWEKIKYVVAKAGGRYKVNGKMFGKKKIRKEEQEKIKALLEKESNKILKDVDSKIKQSFPEFPNNESGKDFLSGVENIAAVYDTIVKETEKGEVPVDVSNQMIQDLRDYVKNLLDVELKAFYATVDEQKKHEEYLKLLLEDAAADLRAKLKADREKRGGGKEFQSTKISTLKSNKLPLTLAGVGSSFGAFSWLVNTDWFKSLFDEVTETNYTTLVKEESKEIFKIKKGDGVYKFLSNITGINLDGNQDPQKLVDSLKQIGGGDANKGIELLCQKGGVMMRPEDAEKGLKALIKNPNQYDNLGEFFRGQASGTGKVSPVDTTLYGTISGEQMVATIIKLIPKIFVKQSVTTGAGYAIAKGFGNVLGPIGVGLLVAGATVKLMRMKGLKTSRAATLNALYQSLRDLPGGGEIVPTEGPLNTDVEVGVPEVRPTTDTSVPSRPSATALKPSTTDTATTEPERTAAGAEEPEKEPSTEPAPESPEEGEPTKKEKEEDKKEADTSSDYDKLYKILRSTFRYIGDSRDTLYKKSSSDKDLPVLEGRYIQSKKALTYISDKIGYKKVEAFEKLIAKMEAIKDNIILVRPGIDKDLDALVTNMKKNPLFTLNLRDLFNVEFAEKERLEELTKFIGDVFEKMYKKNIGDKNLAKSGYELSRVSTKKKKELVKEISYIATSSKTPKLGDVTYSTGLLRNVLVFLMDSFKLFQYLHKLKNNISGTIDTGAVSASSVEAPKTKSSATDVSLSPKKEKETADAKEEVYKLSDEVIDKKKASKETKRIMRSTRATIKTMTDKKVVLNLYKEGPGTSPVERRYTMSEWDRLIKNGTWEIAK